MSSLFPSDRARGVATRLLLLFGAAVLALGISASLAVWALWQRLGPEMPWPPAVFAFGAVLIVLVVFWRTLAELRRLGTGGAGLAARLGARTLDDTDALHRRLRDVAEEVAVAAGIAVPNLYTLDDASINAVAAGDRPAIAAVIVTRGALERLDRAQLQGVVATRIAQIVDGSAALNLRIAAALYGLSWLRLNGRRLARLASETDDDTERRPLPALPALAARPLAALMAVAGALGAAAARLLRAGIGRERVFRADAMALLLTGDRDSLASALRRVTTEQARQSASRAASRSAPDAGYLELIGPLLLVDPTGAAGRFVAHPSIGERIDRMRGRRSQGSAGRRGAGWLHGPSSLLARCRVPARRLAPRAGNRRAPAGATPAETPAWQSAEAPGWVETMTIALEDRPAALPLSATPAIALISRLRTAAVSRDEAGRWLCALVVGVAPDGLRDEPDPRVAAALRWLLTAEGAALRVPVLELMLARLRRWSSAHRREMLERCRRALERDRRADSADWVLYTLARHRLGAAAGSARARAAPAGRMAHGRALGALFAMAAAIGEASLRTTRDTLAETAALLDVPPPAATPDELDTAELARALDLLVSLPAADKPVLLRMLLRMARTPGHPDFDAFVRAVAAAIDCPLPRAQW
ncbi:MAG: M48 family metalloprotease [Limnobacter sp.]|nr:M48 family metalloprotease [Limnobacter sp.]